MPDGDLDLRVKVTAWREVPPRNGYSPIPDRVMDVRVSDGEVSATSTCHLCGEDAMHRGEAYMVDMRDRTIQHALRTFMGERSRADAALREVAEARFDHRPNMLMPEDFYS